MADCPAPQADSAGLGSQLADAIGGLLNRPEDALPDPPEIKDELDDRTSRCPTKRIPMTTKSPKTNQTEETDELAETEEPATEPDDACAEEPVDETPPASRCDAAARTDAATAAAHRGSATEPEPLSAETPCEIAADELPQAGP